MKMKAFVNIVVLVYCAKVADSTGSVENESYRLHGGNGEVRVVDENLKQEFKQIHQQDEVEPSYRQTIRDGKTGKYNDRKDTQSLSNVDEATPSAYDEYDLNQVNEPETRRASAIDPMGHQDELRNDNIADELMGRYKQDIHPRSFPARKSLMLRRFSLKTKPRSGKLRFFRGPSLHQPRFGLRLGLRKLRRGGSRCISGKTRSCANSRVVKPIFPSSHFGLGRDQHAGVVSVAQRKRMYHEDRQPYINTRWRG